MAKTRRNDGRRRPSQRQDTHQLITDTIIELIEESGTLPWDCGWIKHQVSAIRDNGEGFTGSNRYLTWVAHVKGYTSPYWMTLKQANKHGGRVKQGEKSMVAIRPQQRVVKVRDENGKPKVDKDGKEEARSWTEYRHYRVFNACQCEGLPEHFYPQAQALPEKSVIEIQLDADAVIKEYLGRPGAPRFSIQGQSAYYSPIADEVVMPERRRFKSTAHWYSTAFHELGHSTGAKSRLDRDGVTQHARGSEYGKEELVAELTAAYLCADVGLSDDTLVRNSAAYIQGWLKALRDNPKWIIWASARAEDATSFIKTGATKGRQRDEDQDLAQAA